MPAIAEEVLAEGASRDLAAALAQQPPWSEPPRLLLSERGANSLLIAIRVGGRKKTAGARAKPVSRTTS